MSFVERRTAKYSMYLEEYERVWIEGKIKALGWGFSQYVRFCCMRVATMPKCFDLIKKLSEEMEEDMKARTEKRGERIQILVTPTESSLIENAAQRQGMTVSSFMRFVAMRVATNVQVETTVLQGMKEPGDKN